MLSMLKRKFLHRGILLQVNGVLKVILALMDTFSSLFFHVYTYKINMEPSVLNIVSWISLMKSVEQFTRDLSLCFQNVCCLSVFVSAVLLT